MKVKCIENKKTALPKDLLGDRFHLYQDFSLVIDQEYTVYAIREINNHIWYCICDEDYISHPNWNPSPLFEITDPRLSLCWIFSFEKSGTKMTPIISFPEWANDPTFYSELVEASSSDPTAIAFNKYKELMDLEFLDASINLTAEVGDAEWLICPKCLDGWKSSNNQTGMVRCPNCKEILQNPRYASSSKC